MSMKGFLRWIILGILIIIGIFFAGYIFQFFAPAQPPEFHIHADFKMIANDTPIDFSTNKYMSTETRVLDPYIHLHDGESNLIHMHAPNQTLGKFFRSIGFQLTSTCFTLDTNVSYCNDGSKTLKLFVNGQPNTQFENYIFNDLDRILITYGDDSPEAIAQQIASVSDEACIESNKCPERGSPGDESSCSVAGGCVVPGLAVTPDSNS